ncbi:PCYCGC motif-containing (lipo)protein [Effusibacillus pohliae]|uniref:PCYCGC motif-containing (lipo)protein n=1 Tax=Effusibacillus pohliae TaxID=232270 RepID=UPI000371B364|nr:PCYCGC motif-containing (lipo)protein [Effusibacillus pohliae]
MNKLLLPITLAFALAGCSQAATPGNGHETGHSVEAHGDIQEKTASVEQLPSFLKSMPEQTQQIYTLAAKNSALLQNIPCYCGCGDSVGHKSNADCFVKEVKPDGIVWDSHGSKCGVCMAIAMESVKLQSEGKSPKEIRSYIDSKYGAAGAKPTPTPMPN